MMKLSLIDTLAMSYIDPAEQFHNDNPELVKKAIIEFLPGYGVFPKFVIFLGMKFQYFLMGEYRDVVH